MSIIKLFLLSLSFIVVSQSVFAQSYGHGSCSEVANEALVRSFNMAITCSVSDSSQDTFVLVDTENLTFNPATQSPAMFIHPDWTAENIGFVYATEYDLQGNIYVAASRIFTSLLPNSHQYGSLGATSAFGPSGVIYKMDAITGAPSVWASLPQDMGIPLADRLGLGGITYDRVTNSMYVVNRFDNTIYQLDGTTGATISTYTPDPILDLGGESSFEIPFSTEMGMEQAVPFGLDIYQGRLYYTVQNTETNSNIVLGGVEGSFRAGLPTVRSIAIASNGSLTVGSDTLEVKEALTLTNQPGDGFFTLSGDIDFSQDGQMSLGTYTAGSFNCPIAGPYWACMYNHESYVLTYTGGASGAWAFDKFTTVGQEPFSVASSNYTATGSVAYNPFPYNEDILWMTGGDFLGEDSNWGVIGYDANTLTSSLDPVETSSSYIQFLYGIPENLNFSDPKGVGGEVDIFTCVEVNIGNYVFFDANGDGLQDAGDTPIVGATVNLYDKATGALLDTVLTDGAGQYQFLNVPPGVAVNIKLDNLADYAAGGPLESLGATLLDIGSDNTVDNDAMDMGGFPAIMTTTPDFVEAQTTEDTSFDFGLVEVVRIGDTVWFDTDMDGVQDSGEFTIGGATVNLYDAAGVLIATTTTDSNGNYFFNVTPGVAVSVKLDKPADYAAGGPLFGLIPTAADAGGDDAADSDAIDMGGFGAIMVTTPATGEDLSLDFGFVGENAFLHDGALQGLIDPFAVVLSRLNLNLGRALLRSSNQCSSLSKKRVRRLRSLSEDLYLQVWNDIWVNTKTGLEANCLDGYDNTATKASIVKSVRRLNKINKRLVGCMEESSSARAARVRRRFKRQMKELNAELVSVPDTVQCRG